MTNIITIISTKAHFKISSTVSDERDESFEKMFSPYPDQVRYLVISEIEVMFKFCYAANNQLSFLYKSNQSSK